MPTKKRIMAEYEKYRRKYDLPKYLDLDHEFELTPNIRNLDAEDIKEYLLKEIRRHMVERFNSWVLYFNSFLYPSQESYIDLTEYKHFSEEDQKLLTELLNNFMFISRISVKLDLLHSPKDEADYIKTYFQVWLEMKKIVHYLVDKNIKGWHKITHGVPEPQERISYYG